MKPGMKLLLQILRGETLTAPPSVPEWLEALELADQECVLPFCVAQIRSLSMAIPDEISTRLAVIERESAISTFWWTSELSGILSALNDESVPVIPLKGPLLAQRLYGDIHLRTSRDIDLLVRASDLKAAGASLTGLGFTAAFRPDDYHESWRRGTTLVELHHNVENPLAFRMDIDAIWRRAAEVDFHGLRILQLAPQDELLFLCLHGVRHCFERLSHVLDLTLAFEQLAPHVPPAALSSDLSSTLRPLVVLGHAMTRKLRPQLPALPFDIPLTELTHQDTVATKRWKALEQETRTPLDWQAQHRFYLELESTQQGRLLRSARHLLILSTRLIQADFDFAARYHVALPWLVWIIRQLRLIRRAASPARRHAG
jgi:hypothetical protein